MVEESRVAVGHAQVQIRNRHLECGLPDSRNHAGVAAVQRGVGGEAVGQNAHDPGRPQGVVARRRAAALLLQVRARALLGGGEDAARPLRRQTQELAPEHRGQVQVAAAGHRRGLLRPHREVPAHQPGRAHLRRRRRQAPLVRQRTQTRLHLHPLHERGYSRVRHQKETRTRKVVQSKPSVQTATNCNQRKYS